MTSVVTILLAYFLGSFPTAYLLGKVARGIDIRLTGSRNPGALNAYRQLGWVYGLIVLAVDTGKGILTIYAGRWMEAPDIAIYIAALTAVIGHNWSVFLKFKGGKGVAVVLGLSLALLPLLTAVMVLIFGVALVITRNVMISMIVGFVALNAMIIGTLQPLPMIILCLILTTIVAVTHFLRAGNQLIPAVRLRDWRGVTKIE